MDMNLCHRCRKEVMSVHPLGWIEMVISSPVMEEDGYTLLCASCMTDFGEWLIPDLKECGQWISEKDQLQAYVQENFNRRD